MSKPRVLVLRAPGTNCDLETAFAFEAAGAECQSVHINRLLEDSTLPEQYQILCLPGGFSYGDDVAAGRILAGQIRHHLTEALTSFKDAGKLILGICNGFQVLIKSGLLLPDVENQPVATLTWNDSHKFEDRWVHLSCDQSKCVFLKGIDSMYLPMAHAEGKFVTQDAATLAKLGDAGQVALRYATAVGPATSQLDYPLNPNGSPGNVAGVCDDSGRVLGLMPHPERHIDPTQHPHWTRGPLVAEGDGLAMFRNAVEYFG